jgi:hypothetical protein
VDRRALTRALLFAPAAAIAAGAVARALAGWSDFDGYLIAGEALRAGAYSDHVFNTWPPFFSVFAAGLVELARLPPPAARLLWALLNAAVFTYACVRWWRAAGGREAPGWVAPLAALAIAPFLALHLLTHQVYSLVFAMGIEAFLDAERGRDVRAGAWLGLAGALKVTPALLLPYFLLQRRWKLAATSAAVALACSLAVVPFLGLRGTVDAHRRWIARAVALRGTHGIRNQSVLALVERLTTGEAKREQAGIDPLLPLNGGTADRAGRFLSWALILGSAAALRRVRPVLAAGPLLAVSVLAAPYCWRTQLIALFPLLFLTLRRLARRPGALDLLLCLPFFLCMVEREPGLVGLRAFELLEGAGLTCAVCLLLVLNALRPQGTLQEGPALSPAALPPAS